MISSNVTPLTPAEQKILNKGLEPLIKGVLKDLGVATDEAEAIRLAEEVLIEMGYMPGKETK